MKREVGIKRPYANMQEGMSAETCDNIADQTLTIFSEK